MELERLRAAAIQGRELAYAPYSRFSVGAALLCREGELFIGGNIENLSYGLTLCAERAAVSAAIMAGRRDWLALGIIASSRQPITPCGACRQVLAEFVEELPVYSWNLDGERVESSLAGLLPRPHAGILDRVEGSSPRD